MVEPSDDPYLLVDIAWLQQRCVNIYRTYGTRIKITVTVPHATYARLCTTPSYVTQSHRYYTNLCFHFGGGEVAVLTEPLLDFIRIDVT